MQQTHANPKKDTPSPAEEGVFTSGDTSVTVTSFTLFSCGAPAGALSAGTTWAGLRPWQPHTLSQEEWQVSLPQPLDSLVFLLLRDEKDVDIMTIETYMKQQKYYSRNAFSSILLTSQEPLLSFG